MEINMIRYVKSEIKKVYKPEELIICSKCNKNFPMDIRVCPWCNDGCEGTKCDKIDGGKQYEKNS